MGLRTRQIGFARAFAAAWLAGQAVLIGTAAWRPDGAFGFRMFSESTTISIHLERELAGGVTVPIVDGAWVANDASGTLHRFAWTDRVADPVLRNLELTVHAAYGEAAQLARLQAALDDVAEHIPEDHETCALIAHVSATRNGHEPEEHVLRSAPRTNVGGACAR
jgi:hypothetical protein